MTKIDETKQYKFSEIVRMVEDKELPIDTKVFGGYGKSRTLNVQPTMENYGLQDETEYQSFNKAVIGSYDINNMWTIKLPKEEQFYLKAPECFGVKYLNLQFSSGEYFFASSSNTVIFQSQFTQSEIDAMPFDTNFFEKIKAED
ncbi:hypothetical protein [Carnobacterium divergens]|uniref:hypothetical protein n=1 Tax=Carnobacterium divergens TaxID=2748 RepID=UPI00288FC2FC|nr:hypothetical protein [Carnobacterium divergens]MDT2011148.1 hypothetical protein [Carnobacterium divergens]